MENWCRHHHRHLGRWWLSPLCHCSLISSILEVTRANGNTLWAAVLYLVLALGKAEIALLGWTETAAVTYHNIWEGYCLPFFSFGSSTVAEAERAAAWQSHGCQAMSKRWMHSSAQLASSKLYSSGNDLVSRCHRSFTASDTQDHPSRTLSEASLYLDNPSPLCPKPCLLHSWWTIPTTANGSIFQRTRLRVKILSVVVGKWSHREHPNERDYSHRNRWLPNTGTVSLECTHIPQKVKVHDKYLGTNSHLHCCSW